jgi:hypothetical protein
MDNINNDKRRLSTIDSSKKNYVSNNNTSVPKNKNHNRQNSNIKYELNRMRHNNNEFLMGMSMMGMGDLGLISTKCNIPEFQLHQMPPHSSNLDTSHNTQSSNLSSPRRSSKSS